VRFVRAAPALAIAREMHRVLRDLGADAYALATFDSMADFYRLADATGAPPVLCGIIGSYGDTLDDEQVLSMLEDWNAGRPTFHSSLDERH
jgi:hypothetical protein